ncbi:MAG: lysophospholipase [Alphaproteobacteria bacterium]|nr:lysophospholipase [Alphaproteobacteria bacterium]
MKTNFLVSGDGTKLAYFDRYVKNSKLGVIILHGLAEHKGRYEEFINSLAASGISVFAVDLRGHGESGGRRGDAENFDGFLSDLDLFVRHIKSRHPDLKLAIFGHSMGGLVASVYAANGGAADVLILSSPSLETPRPVQVLRLCPTRIFGKIAIKKRVSESKDMLKYSRRDPLSCRSYTLRLLKAAFIDGVRRAARGFKNIRIPVLMLGGRFDVFVNSGKLGAMLEKFGSLDKTLMIYENAKHRIVQNDAKDKSIPYIIRWIESRLQFSEDGVKMAPDDPIVQ